MAFPNDVRLLFRLLAWGWPHVLRILRKTGCRQEVQFEGTQQKNQAAYQLQY